MGYLLFSSDAVDGINRTVEKWMPTFGSPGGFDLVPEEQAAQWATSTTAWRATAVPDEDGAFPAHFDGDRMRCHAVMLSDPRSIASLFSTPERELELATRMRFSVDFAFAGELARRVAARRDTNAARRYISTFNPAEQSCIVAHQPSAVDGLATVPEAVQIKLARMGIRSSQASSDRADAILEAQFGSRAAEAIPDTELDVVAAHAGALPVSVARCRYPGGIPEVVQYAIVASNPENILRINSPCRAAQLSAVCRLPGIAERLDMLHPDAALAAAIRHMQQSTTTTRAEILAYMQTSVVPAELAERICRIEPRYARYVVGLSLDAWIRLAHSTPEIIHHAPRLTIGMIDAAARSHPATLRGVRLTRKQQQYALAVDPLHIIYIDGIDRSLYAYALAVYESRQSEN